MKEAIGLVISVCLIRFCFFKSRNSQFRFGNIINKSKLENRNNNLIHELKKGNKILIAFS
jgi:hypothetical protein